MTQGGVLMISSKYIAGQRIAESKAGDAWVAIVLANTKEPRKD